eukprot:9500471-Pyramimonas_sp.AAC.1
MMTSMMTDPRDPESRGYNSPAQARSLALLAKKPLFAHDLEPLAHAGSTPFGTVLAREAIGAGLGGSACLLKGGVRRLDRRGVLEGLGLGLALGLGLRCKGKLGKGQGCKGNLGNVVHPYYAG